MWVYKSEDVAKRANLPEPAQFLLDYWLFLHGTETPSSWCARPLGSLQIAATALSATDSESRTLRQQLALEATAIARLAPYVASLPRPPSNAPLDAGRWQPEWIAWFERITERTDPRTVVSELSEAVGTIVRTDLWTAAYLMRRLSAELVDSGWVGPLLFKRVKRQFCSEDAFADPTADIAAIFTKCFSLGQSPIYTVTIPLAPVKVSRRMLRRIREPVLRVEETSQGMELTGAIVSVRARNSNEAATMAIRLVAKLLEKLRLFFYVITHLAGDVHVVSLASDPPGRYTSAASAPVLACTAWPQARSPRATEAVRKDTKGATC